MFWEPFLLLLGHWLWIIIQIKHSAMTHLQVTWNIYNTFIFLNVCISKRLTGFLGPLKDKLARSITDHPLYFTVAVSYFSIYSWFYTMTLVLIHANSINGVPCFKCQSDGQRTTFQLKPQYHVENVMITFLIVGKKIA